MFKNLINEIKQNKRAKWLTIGISLASISGLSAILGPAVAFTVQKNNSTIKQENLIDRNFENWNKNQNTTQTNNIEKNSYEPDNIKLDNVTDQQINDLIYQLYLEQKPSFEQKTNRTIDENDKYNNYIKFNEPIDVNATLDTYVNSQKRRFDKKPTANINVAFKKNIFVPHNQFNFLELLNKSNFISIIFKVIDWLKIMKKSNFVLYEKYLKLFMKKAYKFPAQLKDENFWKRLRKENFLLYTSLVSFWDGLETTQQDQFKQALSYILEKKNYNDLYQYLMYGKINNDNNQEHNSKQRGLLNSLIDSINYVIQILKQSMNNVPITTIDFFIQYFNNNYNNTYNINLSSWSASSDRKYVGNCVIVPMYSAGVKIEKEAKTINSIDLSLVNNIFVKPITEFYKNLKEQNKKFVDLLFQTLSPIFKLNNKKIYNKLLPQIRLNVENKKDFSKKIQTFNFGNFKLKKLNLNSNEYYINSNNFFKTNLAYENSVCNGPTCSHNLYGINRLIHEIIKLLKKEIGSKVFYKIIYIVISVLFPIFSIIGTIFLDVSLNDVWNNPNLVKIMNFLFGIKTPDDIKEFIIDSLLYLWNVWNVNSTDLLLSYRKQFPMHGFDVGKCGTLKVNLEIDTTKKLQDENINLYLYSSSWANEQINCLFKIDNKRIIFDKKVILMINVLANYSYLYEYLKKDNNLPNDVFKKLKENIVNHSMLPETIYIQYLDYCKNKKQPEVRSKQLKIFDYCEIEKQFKIDSSLPIEDYKIFKEQILTDIVNQNIYFHDKGTGKNIKIFNDGKLNKDAITECLELDSFKNYVFIDFKDTGIDYKRVQND